MRFLIFLFIGMPILEIWLLIQVGGVIGSLNTIGLVVLTAIVGIALLRQQGLNTLMRANQRLAAQQLPAEEVLEGILIAVGGAFLLTPGFITDSFALACLLPGLRQYMIKHALRRVQVSGWQHSEVHQNQSKGQTLEGEYERKD